MFLSSTVAWTASSPMARSAQRCTTWKTTYKEIMTENWINWIIFDHKKYFLIFHLPTKLCQKFQFFLATRTSGRLNAKNCTNPQQNRHKIAKILNIREAEKLFLIDKTTGKYSLKNQYIAIICDWLLLSTKTLFFKKDAFPSILSFADWNLLAIFWTNKFYLSKYNEYYVLNFIVMLITHFLYKN